MVEDDMWQLPMRSKTSLFEWPRDDQTQKFQPCAAGTTLSKSSKRWSRLILALQESDDIVCTVQPALSRLLTGILPSTRHL